MIPRTVSAGTPRCGRLSRSHLPVRRFQIVISSPAKRASGDDALSAEAVVRATGAAPVPRGVNATFTTTDRPRGTSMVRT